MKNIIVWAFILAIVGYIVLNYQVTQYHFYEGVSFKEINSHRAIRGGSYPEDLDFVKRGGFELVKGDGTVIEYAKLVKKATPNVNDDEIEAFSIYLPFKNLAAGDSKSFAYKSGAVVYYIGNKNRFPCYGYPTNGKITINKKDGEKLSANIFFVVDLITLEGNDCKTVEFNKDVSFKKAAMGETWSD